MTDLLREYWDWFLLDTLLWTGALIGLVLMLRRPVSRHFGSGAAYALWFLPLARLAFPPVQLPAWMKPISAAASSDVAPVIADNSASIDTMSAMGTFEHASFMPAAAPEQLVSPIDFVTPIAIVWLLGATIFLARRFWLYGALRKELLAEARPVGDVGSIRLVETPAISGPMAFGVIDKVVALPPGFIASRDRQSRDLAIEHELAHHRGQDLLVNILVQPLFAAHWFNPLGWIGWNALRRDQEAACDARVVAARPREERAAYAGIIAEFARRPQIAPRPALAAPMACPVLGDKSIIHRLRSLSMSDISPRRRWAGRSGIVAALLALPLTATICYSEAIAAPEPPAPPAAPFAPNAPVAPDAPEPPEAPEPDLDQDIDLEIDRVVEIEMQQAEEEMARAERELDRAERKMERVERDLESGDHKRIAKHRIEWNGKDWQDLTAAEREKVRKDLRETRRKMGDNGEIRREMAKAHREIQRELGENGEMRREIRLAVAEAQAAGVEARAMAPKVVMECRDEDSPVTTETDSSGKTTMFVCESYGDKIALKAMRSARKAIAIDRNLSNEERAEALRELDREIADLSH